MGESRTYHPWFPVMQGRHSVVQMGDMGHPQAHRFAGRLIVRPRVSHRDHHAARDGGQDQLTVFGELGGDGQKANHACAKQLLARHRAGPGYMCRSLGTGVARIEKGPLQMRTKERCPARTRGHRLADRVQRSQDFRQAGRHGRGQKTRHPVAGVKSSHRAQCRRVCVHGIAAQGAVCVQVDQARCQHLAGEIDRLSAPSRSLRRLTRAQLYNAALLRQHPALGC